MKQWNFHRSNRIQADLIVSIISTCKSNTLMSCPHLVFLCSNCLAACFWSSVLGLLWEILNWPRSHYFAKGSQSSLNTGSHDSRKRTLWSYECHSNLVHTNFAQTCPAILKQWNIVRDGNIFSVISSKMRQIVIKKWIWIQWKGNGRFVFKWCQLYVVLQIKCVFAFLWSFGAVSFVFAPRPSSRLPRFEIP